MRGRERACDDAGGEEEPSADRRVIALRDDVDGAVLEVHLGTDLREPRNEAWK